MAGVSRLGPLACLAPGEVLNCRQTRFAPLALAPGAPDPAEGLALKPESCPARSGCAPCLWAVAGLALDCSVHFLSLIKDLFYR
jgi:hypothetical protein